MCSKTPLNSPRTLNNLNFKSVEIMEEMDLNGDCEFFRAVSKADYFTIQTYLDAGGDIDLVNPYNLKTALFMAVDDTNADMILFLLERGADVNHKDSAGFDFKTYILNFF